MSTRTPSLRGRVVALGVTAVAMALLVVNVAVQLVLRAGWEMDLLVAQVVVSVLAVCGAGAALLWGARATLAPVQEVAAAAAGLLEAPRGQRLQPDRASTELGRMATAFDEMLDHVEAGLQIAAKLERRSGTFETRWRQVLEAAPEAYLAVDPDGTVVDANRRAEELFGLPRQALCGRSATALLPERHRAQVIRTLADIAAQGPTATMGPFELQALAQDGRRFPAECTVWAVDRRGGTVVHTFVRDVSERREAQETTLRLAAVIEGSFDAIVTEDLTGVIRTWNQAAVGMFGWLREEAVGHDVGLIVPQHDREQHRRLVARIARGEQVAPFEGEYLTRGGTTVPVSLRLSPVHNRHGVVVGASSLVRDVTEHRWMAETLDASLMALQSALDDARASEETTRRFLDDAAHQLRTPMAGIRACAETLLRGAAPDDADRLLVTMVRETSHAARLISTLLQMARLDQGLPTQREPVDLVATCAQEVERLSLLSPDLTVVLSAQQAPPGPLLLDLAACEELLSNLGDNARRHAGSRIEICIAGDGDRVRVVLADDGPGVPVAEQERVFDRFVSLDGAGGSGLGLPIARSLARAMGGDLRYEHGFVLELPAEPALTETTSSCAWSEKAPG